MAFAWSLGINGFEVQDADTGAPPGRLGLAFYLPPDTDQTMLETQAVQALGPTIELQWSLWDPPSVHSPAVPLGRNFRVLAADAKAPKQGRRTPLFLDTQGAWGDGRHGSTRAAVRLLEDHHLHNKSVLDWGCGSGALCLIAGFAGAKPLWAIDTDALARNATQAAADRAALQVHVAAEPPSHLQFDLVIANLPALDLLPLFPALAAAVSPGGSLLLSGAPTKAWPQLLRALPTWHTEARARSGTWGACLLRNPQ
jgi:ribosomal protein L11 methylase PrmA